MSDAHTEYWDQVLAKLVATPEWSQVLETNVWESMFLRSAEARKFLDTEFQELQAILGNLGLAK
jgi:tripartite-type tricarboxylate transporter receptor subunit TctC